MDEAAQYISSMLNDEAQRQLAKKITEEQKTKTRRTRNSLLANKTDKGTNNKKPKSKSNKTKSTGLNWVDFIETFINELEETLTTDTDKTIQLSDSQDTPFSASQLDDT